MILHSVVSRVETTLRYQVLRQTCLLQFVRTEVLHTRSAVKCNTTAPDIGCPCTPAKAPTAGACSAGFICRTVSSVPQPNAHSNDNNTAKCWPCSFGQYCPAGSYLPDDSYSLPEAVKQYTCRYKTPSTHTSESVMSICAKLLVGVRCLQDWSLLSYPRCDAAMPTGHFLLGGDLQLLSAHCSATFMPYCSLPHVSVDTCVLTVLLHGSAAHTKC